MKTALKIAAGAAALSALAGVAHAQGSATASATGTASVINPITLTKTADLAFGSVARPSTGTGTVTMSSTGNTRTFSGGAAAGVAAGTQTSAAFSVTGEGGQTFTLGVPASFSMANGTNSLVVTTSTTGAATSTLSGSAGSVGSLLFGVGGTFPLASGAATGAYSGTFNVTVVYN